MMINTTIDAKLDMVQLGLNRNDRDMAPESYMQQFNGLSLRWGLIVNDDKI